VVVFLNEELEVIQPGQVPAVLADHKRRLVHLEKWQEKQNGTLGRLETKVDKVSEDMHSKFDELKDLIHASREKASESDQKINDKRDSNLKQRITWILACFVGIPSAIWSFIQVFQFLATRK